MDKMAIDIGGMLARSGAVTGQLMGQGLSNLGTGIGAGVSGMLTRRKEREEQAQVQKLLEASAKNPTELARLEQQYRLKGKTDIADMFAKASVSAKGVLQQQGMNSISAIRQQLMQETDPDKMQLLEDAMVDVARRTGQEDPSALIGTSNKIQDARTIRQIKLDERREKAVADAYYAVSSEAKEEFIKNAEQSGYADIIRLLETDRLKHEDYLEKREKARSNARAPLDIPSIEERIADLPENLQQDFKARLEEIKESQPDFENGGTWMGNERERAWRKLDSLSRDIGSAKGDILSRANSRAKSIQVELKSINNDLESPASSQESKLFIPTAKDLINAEVDPIIGEIKATDPRVVKRAIELATQDKVDRLTKRKKLLEQELAEVQEVFKPSKDSEKDSDTDPLGIR